MNLRFLARYEGSCLGISGDIRFGIDRPRCAVARTQIAAAPKDTIKGHQHGSGI